MPYIYENRSVRHDAGPDMRFQLKEFLMQEVDRAWRENSPYGNVTAGWDEESVTISIDAGGMIVSSVTYKRCKD